MQMSSTSIFAIGSAVIAPLAVFLRYLLKQPPKVASTSEELLDLFKERYALLEEHATLISPDDEGRASERLTVAVPNDLASVKRFRQLSCRHQEKKRVQSIKLNRERFARYFVTHPADRKRSVAEHFGCIERLRLADRAEQR
jgi:hypothetical protein